MNVAAGAHAISVVAEAAGPIRVALIDPAGAALATAEAVGGVAVIEQAVSEAGLYQVQILNLGGGPVEVWTAATPFGSR